MFAKTWWSKALKLSCLLSSRLVWKSPLSFDSHVAILPCCHEPGQCATSRARHQTLRNSRMSGPACLAQLVHSSPGHKQLCCIRASGGSTTNLCEALTSDRELQDFTIRPAPNLFEIGLSVVYLGTPIMCPLSYLRLWVRGSSGEGAPASVLQVWTSQGLRGPLGPMRRFPLRVQAGKFSPEFLQYKSISIRRSSAPALHEEACFFPQVIPCTCTCLHPDPVSTHCPKALMIGSCASRGSDVKVQLDPCGQGLEYKAARSLPGSFPSQ